MADLKISQLSDGGNAQAADEFVVARSGNNFRIDGASVAAAATSVGTLSSLTVSGNTSLASSSGGVGIGVAAGSSKLNVAGTFTKNTGDENTWGIRVTDDTAMTTGVGGGLVFVGNYTSGGGKASFASIAGAKANSTTANGLGELRFYTTDVSSVLQQRAVIDSSGRVGIGTASPGYALDVVGGSATALRISGNSAATNNTAMRFYGLNAAADLWAIGNAVSTNDATRNFDIYDLVAGANRFRIDASGNLAVDTNTLYVDAANNRVGIGTASPQVALDVIGVINATATINSTGGAIISQLNGSDTAANGAYVGLTNTANNRYWLSQLSASNNLDWWYYNGSTWASPKMTLDASGNLLVGRTTANNNRLTIAGTHSSGRSIAAIQTTAAGNGNNVLLGFYNSSDTRIAYIGPDTGTSFEINAQENVPMIISTNNAERARITAGGYFKASNTGTYVSPTGSYHELRSSTNAAGIVITNASATYTDDLIYGSVAVAAGTGFKLMRLDSNSVEQFRVRGDGTIFAQNTTVQSLSDARLKENISDATEGLAVITALRPVRYDWKKGYGNDRVNQLGFIAQEVEAVFPEAVSVWEMDEPTGEVDEDGKPITEKVDYKTVGPGALIPVLVKAIQELEARIAVLEAGA